MTSPVADKTGGEWQGILRIFRFGTARQRVLGGAASARHEFNLVLYLARFDRSIPVANP